MKKLFAGLISLAATMFAVYAITVCAGAETSGDYEYRVLDDGTVNISHYMGNAEELTIPSTIDGKKVTSIGGYAFSNSPSLISINIPDSVTTIKDGIVSDCSNLISITVDINNQNYSSKDGVLFNKDMSEIIACPGGKNGEYKIPDSVKNIGDHAFESCQNLDSIIIPDSVHSIGESALYKCSKLTSITIPDSVTDIGDGAFEVCISLTSINIPKGVTSIGNRNFWGCSNLSSIDIPDGVTKIGDSAFYDCSNLTSINIPDSVTKIGDTAFYDCSNLTSINIPAKVTDIGKYAFNGNTSLTSISVDENNPNFSSKDGVLFNKDMATIILCPAGREGEFIIPDSVTEIGDGAFGGCAKLTSVIIPDGVTSIVDNAFNECSSLISITIPDGVKSIGYGTFGDCSNLTSIVIPDSMTSIGEYAFYWCFSFKDVYFAGSKAQWDNVIVNQNGNDNLLNATIHYNYVPAPSSVSGLKLKARAADALRLTWTKNPSADGYIIEMKDGSKWTRVGKITKNSTVEFKKSKLKAGTAYTFRIKAYKMSGKTALYGATKTISVRTNPSAVSGLKLKARAADALRLTWAKNTSADGYIIEIKSGSKWTRVGKITKNSTVEFKKSKLKAGTAYTFRVKAYKMSGKTALYGATKTISVRTNPSATTGLKLKASAKDAVRLSWTKNTSADGYIIEMKSGTKWVRVGKITKNSTVEFKKSKLKSNTSYSFRIKAYKMSGKTALYGATKTITVKTK